MSKPRYSSQQYQHAYEADGRRYCDDLIASGATIIKSERLDDEEGALVRISYKDETDFLARFRTTDAYDFAIGAE